MKNKIEPKDDLLKRTWEVQKLSDEIKKALKKQNDNIRPIMDMIWKNFSTRNMKYFLFIFLCTLCISCVSQKPRYMRGCQQHYGYSGY